MNWVGGLGLAMLAIGLAVILLELLLILTRLLSLRRKILTLRALLDEQNISILGQLLGLREQRAERLQLTRPYARIHRWVTHPVTLALIGSYRRRLAQR